MKKMKSIRQINNQSGFTLLEMGFVVTFMSILFIQLAPAFGLFTDEKLRQHTFIGVSQIAQASKAYYVDETNPATYRTWPANVAALASYLPNFNNFNAVGQPYVIVPSGGAIVIETDVVTQEDAVDLATRLGPSASVAGSVVSYGVVRPGAESSHDALVARDGSKTMQATLDFEHLGGVPSDVDLNELGSVIDAQEIDARIPSGTGLVDANAMTADIVTADEFFYQ